MWKLSYSVPTYPNVGDRTRWDAWRQAYLNTLFAATRLSQSQASTDSVAASIDASFPPPAATAKTDADGRFTLTLKRGDRYALRAVATRAVFNNTEMYEWLIWLTPSKDGARIILANDNMIDTEVGREAKREIDQWGVAGATMAHK